MATKPKERCWQCRFKGSDDNTLGIVLYSLFNWNGDVVDYECSKCMLNCYKTDIALCEAGKHRMSAHSHRCLNGFCNFIERKK
jgi:hypothetical protein